jgi:hypothetical protein
MPPLAGTFDLRDDMRGQMQLASQLGGAIGSVINSRRIRQEEEYRAVLDQTFIGLVNRAATEGWDGARLLGELANVPGMAQTEYGRKVQMSMAMDQYERMQAAAAANAPAPEGMEVIGGRRDKYGNFIPSYGKVNQVILHGPGGMKYTYDPATKTATPIQGIQPSDSRETEEMKVIQAMSETDRQINALNLAIEQGFDKDGNPVDPSVVPMLRNQIASLKAEQELRRRRLSDSEALADYELVKNTVLEDLNRGDEVMRIGESMPLSGYLEGIEQTQKAGVFDNVKDPAKIKEAMGRHVQDLVAQGLTLPEARAESERQMRLLQKADSGWFKTLPSEPIRAPLGAEYEGDEQFLADYKAWAKLNGLNENPDDPGHKYDYRAYYKKYGKFPTKKGEHLPAEFKTEGHPTRLVNGLDTTKEHSDEEILAAYKGDRAAAERDGWTLGDKPTQKPPARELEPFWEGLSDEDKANVRAALKNGYSVQEIIDAIKG